MVVIVSAREHELAQLVEAVFSGHHEGRLGAAEIVFFRNESFLVVPIPIIDE